MILIFITCKNETEAGKIGMVLVKKRLAGCVVLIPGVSSIYWWPPLQRRIEKSREVILLVKTLNKNYSRVEKEVRGLHSYKVPCILSIPAGKVNRAYLKWLKKEVR